MTVEVLHTIRHLLRSAIHMKLGLQSEYFFLQNSRIKNKSVLYDASEGGNGSIITITKRIKYLLERMQQILASCTCSNVQGCPKERGNSFIIYGGHFYKETYFDLHGGHHHFKTCISFKWSGGGY